MPLSPSLAQWLIDAGHEAIHVSDIGMARASDTEIVARAKREGRTVITADLDYSRLLALTGAMEPSVILFRGGDWTDADVIARVDRLLRSTTGLDLERSAFVIEPNRVRIGPRSLTCQAAAWNMVCWPTGISPGFSCGSGGVVTLLVLM